MKIVKTASGKKKLKLSRKEWQDMGRKAGWGEGDDQKKKVYKNQIPGHHIFGKFNPKGDSRIVERDDGKAFLQQWSDSGECSYQGNVSSLDEVVNYVKLLLSDGVLVPPNRVALVDLDGNIKSFLDSNASKGQVKFNIKRDEVGDYVVKVWINGEYNEDKSYFANDLSDAQSTMSAMEAEYKSLGYVVV